MADEVRRFSSVSVRRACRALPVDGSTYHYGFKRSGQAVPMKRIKEIAETRVRYGYWRICFAGKDGWSTANGCAGSIARWGLQLRNKSPKRRVKAQLREHRARR